MEEYRALSTGRQRPSAAMRDPSTSPRPRQSEEVDVVGEDGQGDRAPERTSGMLHFAGVAGSGMSALAQFHVMSGGRASGSDRAFDRGELPEIRAALQRAGIIIVAQDGSFPGVRPDAVIVSTAVEDTVPDVRAARAAGIPVRHRSELLAGFVSSRRTIAVSGTSGKSTVTAMIYEILRAAGRDPSIITGGDLLLLRSAGLLGNAAAGRSDLLVVEADESDGSLVRYHPWMGVLLNLQRDHKEPEEIAPLFDRFREQTTGPFVLSDDPALQRWSRGAITFGFGTEAAYRATEILTSPFGCAFTVDLVRFELPVPGWHNISNALAAIAAAAACGVPLVDIDAGLRRFHGVARRFQSLGSRGGVEVIDDFGHNPNKIRASLQAAQLRGERVLAFFQPHGFGPTRFLRDDLIRTFGETLRAQDHLYLPEIYYAGGTAVRDISSRDIADGVASLGRAVFFDADRKALGMRMASDARPGDVILVMGARDPSLTVLARRILDSLPARGDGLWKP